MKKLIPNYYAKNIFSIDPQFLIDKGIKYVFCDLDNTLDAFDVYDPSIETREYVSKLKNSGIKVFIVSNNRPNRVGRYAKGLDVEFLSRSGKPHGKKIKAFIESKNIDLNEVILIGDQLLTDVLAAKNAGIKVFLVDQLVKRDQWCTIINRRIDNILRKKMIKKGIIHRIGG